MKFSNSIEYAIHALVYLARFSGESPILAAEVAETINVSETYLRKVFQQLSRSSIVDSQRGAKGGFYLARPAEAITLKDIVESIDGELPTFTCLKIKRHCSMPVDCAVHRAFSEAKERMAEVLGATTIAELSRELSGSSETESWLPVV